MRRWLKPAILALAACGGGTTSTGQQQQAQDLEEFRDRQFADEELCEKAVANFERAEFEATDVAAREKGLFDRVEAGRRHRDRVVACTRMTRRQARCFAEAPSLQYIANCERFAELQ